MLRVKAIHLELRFSWEVTTRGLDPLTRRRGGRQATSNKKGFAEIDIYVSSFSLLIGFNGEGHVPPTANYP